MSETLPTIILLGPAGSGKGTQGDLLVKKFGYQKVEAGELVREKSKEDSHLGRIIKDINDSGKHLPDDIITDLIKEALDKVDKNDVLLFDGYPRTLEQAKRLKYLLSNLKVAGNIKALWVNVSVKEAKRRLLDRSVCVNGHILIGRDHKVCPVDGAEVKVRDYDHESSINKRLDFYTEQVIPVIEYYRNEGWLVEIDGEKSVDEVHEEIIEKLGL